MGLKTATLTGPDLHKDLGPEEAAVQAAGTYTGCCVSNGDIPGEKSGIHIHPSPGETVFVGYSFGNSSGCGDGSGKGRG